MQPMDVGTLGPPVPMSWVAPVPSTPGESGHVPVDYSDLALTPDQVPENHARLYGDAISDRLITRARVVRHSGAAAIYGVGLTLRKAHLGPIRSPFTYERSQRKYEDAAYRAALSGPGLTDVKYHTSPISDRLPGKGQGRHINKHQARIRDIKLAAGVPIKGRRGEAGLESVPGVVYLGGDGAKVYTDTDGDEYYIAKEGSKHALPEDTYEAVESSSQSLGRKQERRRGKTGLPRTNEGYKTTSPNKERPVVPEGKVSPWARKNTKRLEKAGRAAERRGRRVGGVMGRYEASRSRADNAKFERKVRSQERKSEHKERRLYNRASRKIARQYAGAYAVSRAEQYKPSNLRNTAEYAQEYARSRIRREA